MDNNDLRPTAGQGCEPHVETGGNWRAQLPPDSREKVVNKIMVSLKRQLPFSDQDRLEELKTMAVCFEEKIYTASASQSEYLRKISKKLLAMESKSQNIFPNSFLPSDSSGNNNISLDSGASHNMQPQVHNQGHPLSMPISANQSQGHQQTISQNIPNNMGSTGVQSSASLTSALPPFSGICISQTSVPNGVGQNPTMQNISRIPQNSAGSSLGQGVPSNMFANSQIQMLGRQQVVPQLQQQQAQNPQQQLLKHKGIFQHPFVQSPMQQQQNLLQPTSQKNNVSGLQQQQKQQLLGTQSGNSTMQSQPPGSLLQQQYVIDQQKQLYQSQKPISETSSTSLDSIAQIGYSSGGDLQEEFYQKIKAMKEMYLHELLEIYQKLASTLQQHDSLPQPPQSEQLDKVKLLERTIMLLLVSKNDSIIYKPGLKEKLSFFEKKIASFINTHKVRKPNPSLQQGHLGQPHILQPQSHVSQVQTREDQSSPQIPSMNVQNVQQNSKAGMQHTSLSSLSGVSTLQQNKMKSVQSGSSLDSVQGITMGSLQQTAVGPLQQTTVRSQQSGVFVSQLNIPLESNPNVLQHQHLKEQQLMKQQMMQQQQQLNQQKKLYLKLEKLLHLQLLMLMLLLLAMWQFFSCF